MDTNINKQMQSKKRTGKRITSCYNSIDSSKFYTVEEAIKILKEQSKVKFNETLDIVMNLGVDPKYSDQIVRGMVSMPHGTGKTVKVAVFAKEAHAETAKKAGADVVGAEDLVESIKDGNIDCDIYIATPDMMGVVGRVAKILGPKGKMPNPKLGTVTMDVTQAINNAKSGQVEFKAEKAGIVHAGVGKLSFEVASLVANVKEFLSAIVKAKPSGAKGTYVRSVKLSSTMGMALSINLTEVS
jgi:large subunit ribosomal protein L1